MLHSFIGTYDAGGLRTLRSEDDQVLGSSPRHFGSASFWAILDSHELPPIHRALVLGHRDAAWELLVQRAKALGPTYR